MFSVYCKDIRLEIAIPITLERTVYVPLLFCVKQHIRGRGTREMGYSPVVISQATVKGH